MTSRREFLAPEPRLRLRRAAARGLARPL